MGFSAALKHIHQHTSSRKEFGISLLRQWTCYTNMMHGRPMSSQRCRAWNMIHIMPGPQCHVTLSQPTGWVGRDRRGVCTRGAETETITESERNSADHAGSRPIQCVCHQIAGVSVKSSRGSLLGRPVLVMLRQDHFVRAGTSTLELKLHCDYVKTPDTEHSVYG